MKLVYLESPYAGDVERNLRYLRAALADCLARDEAPFASHGLFTQPGVRVSGPQQPTDEWSRDDVPGERDLGIRAGFAWARHADLVVVYADLGVTRGMQAGIERAERQGQPVEWRRLPGWDRWDQPFAADPECLKSHVPNAETIAAMREMERGGLPRAADVGSLLAELNAPDADSSDPNFDSDPDDGGD